MRIELSPESQAKLEDILEQLYTRHDLDELNPSQLIDALLDLGADLVMAEEPAMPLARDRLIALCGREITEARNL